MSDCKVPCEHCPWRISNHGKRTPWGFYRADNLRRLWNQIRRGGRAQSCHPTDPNHPDHVKAGAKPGNQPQECAGSVILVLQEFTKLKECAADGVIDGAAIETYLKKYKHDGLTRQGLLYWLVQRHQLAGVPYVGGEKLPAVDWQMKGMGNGCSGSHADTACAGGAPALGASVHV